MNDKSPAYKAGFFVAPQRCHILPENSPARFLTVRISLPNRKFSGGGQNFAEDRDKIILKSAEDN